MKTIFVLFGMIFASALSGAAGAAPARWSIEHDGNPAITSTPTAWDAPGGQMKSKSAAGNQSVCGAVPNTWIQCDPTGTDSLSFHFNSDGTRIDSIKVILHNECSYVRHAITSGSSPGMLINSGTCIATWSDPCIGGVKDGYKLTFDLNNNKVTDTSYSFSTCSRCLAEQFTFPALPIQLAYFSGNVMNGRDVHLEWTTISEVNNYGFFIERRADTEQEFSELPNSFVPGHQTTLEKQDYSWTDVNVTPGTHHYRLRQVDLDGDFTYSAVIVLNIEAISGLRIDDFTTAYDLSQNYPNPFNPTTSVRFALPKSSFVTLKIFNLLGQEVATLVNGGLPAGNHEAVWDASKMPSGMYFYRLQARATDGGQTGSFVETKKLVLTR